MRSKVKWKVADESGATDYYTPRQRATGLPAPLVVCKGFLPWRLAVYDCSRAMIYHSGGRVGGKRVSFGVLAASQARLKLRAFSVYQARPKVSQQRRAWVEPGGQPRPEVGPGPASCDSFHGPT